MNYLMLDKDDITKSYGKISKKELLKELDFKEYQLVSFLNNQGVFREKYILVEDDEKDGILIGEVTGKKPENIMQHVMEDSTSNGLVDV